MNLFSRVTGMPDLAHRCATATGSPRKLVISDQPLSRSFWTFGFTAGRLFLAGFCFFFMGLRSKQPDRKPHPFKAGLPDSEVIRTRRDAGEIDVGAQDHNVIFEFRRGTRTEKFNACRIEQRYIVRPLVASDWQLQVQSPCLTRNV
jgi:hypothetical protein